MKIVKKIKAIDTYPIRRSVLKKGKVTDLCFFLGDEDKSTIHLGAFYNEKIIGIVSLFKTRNTNFNEINQFQLKGIAIIEGFRKIGIGTLLLNEVEKICQLNSIDLLWLNACEASVPFYLKLNFKTFGTKFEINGIGTHYKMFKTFASL